MYSTFEKLQKECGFNTENTGEMANDKGHTEIDRQKYSQNGSWFYVLLVQGLEEEKMWLSYLWARPSKH